jgi:hypothetical protein
MRIPLAALPQALRHDQSLLQSTGPHACAVAMYRLIGDQGNTTSATRRRSQFEHGRRSSLASTARMWPSPKGYNESFVSDVLGPRR